MVTVVTGFQDVAVMGQPIQKCSGQLGITEHTGPFRKAQVGGDYVELRRLSTFFTVTAIRLVWSRLILESLEKSLDCCHITVHRSAFSIG